ncbi:MAG: altronate dehydratase family protein [Eubacteriales bacterium]|nr:altronate dehydratase family protein [Eubacteriales bacterium]MDD3880972.1 altronate dehydratase family protein [Eubacteriales bacterium]MDD4511959.1 altronate dehydratase family protein [Eubacteriales bacterium]
MTDKAKRINPLDNVAVALFPLKSGETELGVRLSADIPAGHKFALTDIKRGGNVIKYGCPIGRATEDIPAGAWAHTHNVKTNLSGINEYEYAPVRGAAGAPASGSFEGYRRENGKVGIRNEIWVIPTVGCVNDAAKRIAEKANAALAGRVDGVFAFTHPYGCSQLGDDHKNTQKLLAALVKHPNAGGALVIGLGCENNNIPAFREVLGGVNEKRVKFLVCQDETDEDAAGLRLINEIAREIEGDKRETLPLSELVIGLKCGGSDGLSGITANPLLGRVSDAVCACGGSAILTEVPEMFGAETILMNRCASREIFDKAVSMINGFKEYFMRYKQEIYENPSPGNKAGGITTLEDKSLGCTQKGGAGEVTDVLNYTETLTKKGLNLANGPGNDICAVTALTAAGAQIILFTTGRGTPLGAPVPTVKVSTNTPLSEKKPDWIDFDAGVLAEGAGMDETAAALLALVAETASGRKTKNEISGCRSIAIFKDGVTL